jgi:hypothetical protein
MKKKGIHTLLNHVASAERNFMDREFLSPVLKGGQVRVRIEGLVLTLRVVGSFEPGWAILKPLSMDSARIVRQPRLEQIRNYLGLFPALRLILLTHTDSDWIAIPAQAGDSRFQVNGPVPIHLTMSVEPFERIIARYDGARFLFQEKDSRRNPSIAAYLRKALGEGTAPDKLQKPTLTAEEKEAYRLMHHALEQASRSKDEIRLSDALAHVDAVLQSYIEHKDAYTVSFTSDGQTHVTTVRKDDLSVLSAGICLSGEDQRFDLQSLVGVLREAKREGRFVPVGEEDFGDDY